MQDFISKAASELGLSKASTEQATGGALNFIKENAAGRDFKDLLSKVPGAEAMLDKASGSTGSAGGGLLGKALSAFGGAGGDSALGLAGVLQGAGLGLDKMSSFVPMLVGYCKDKAGPGVIENILAKVPELKKLTG